VTVRWHDLPVNDWVALNAQLRRVVGALGTGSSVVGLPTGGAAGDVLTKDTATDYDAVWQAPVVPPDPVLAVPIHADATANITLTNQPSTEQFLANSNRNIIRVDLSTATDVQLVARVVTGSASVNSPRLRVMYATTFTTALGSYTTIGTTEVACSLTTAGVAASGWVPLVTGAKITACYVAVTQIGGDGVADPALGNITLWIR
jgi:hypothetical protein